MSKIGNQTWVEINQSDHHSRSACSSHSGEKINFERRTYLSTGFPTNMLHDAMERGHIERFSSTLCPVPTDENKKGSIQFDLSLVHTMHGSASSLRTQRASKYEHEFVHMDDKWLHVTEVSKCFYAAPSEKAPYRSSKSRRYIAKVMFLAAVALPRYEMHKNAPFDSKVRIWLMIEWVPASRFSRIRPVEILEMKPLTVGDTFIDF